MTKSEAREYVLRVLAAEARHHIANGSEWLDGCAASEADMQLISSAVKEIADELERRSIRLRISRERRKIRRR